MRAQQSVLCRCGHRLRLLQRLDVRHDSMLDVEHLLVCRFIVALTCEQVIPPDRHVPCVRRGGLKLSIDRSEDALLGKCAAIARGDLGEICRTSRDVRLHGAPSATIQPMTSRAVHLEKMPARVMSRGNWTVMGTAGQRKRCNDRYSESVQTAHGPLTSQGEPAWEPAAQSLQRSAYGMACKRATLMREPHDLQRP